MAKLTRRKTIKRDGEQHVAYLLNSVGRFVGIGQS